MASPNSQTNAINISPEASNRMNMNMNMNDGMQMPGSSMGSTGDAAYSPPTFTYTTADGSTNPMATVDNIDNAISNEADSNHLNAGANRDRRYSDEWDASKVPPSRFQKRKGSIYSTPGSRDGHVDNNYAAKFHAKHAELGYNKVK